ncbi:D-2-hydroxyacid dehydrogenase, partial [Myxococcota bacterium]|nr:D-2-hydroxyacid dehydrogenase [Myxococcota bacterium]
PIAQTVMLYLLALTRDLPGWLSDQTNRVWNPRSIGALQGLRAAVLGMGPIGYEIGRLCQAMRMDPIAFRRHVRGDEPCATYEMSEIDSHLPEMDVIILALPLTPETNQLLNASRLARLKPGVLIVNIGRGGCVDEEALIRALGSGQVGGAGLDVFAEEPLPPESPLWHMPNVIITPHSSGEEPGNHAQATKIFLENVVRYQKGHSLLNAVFQSESP